MLNLFTVFLVLICAPLLLFFIIIFILIKFLLNKKNDNENLKELLELSQEINSSLANMEKRITSIEDIIKFDKM